MGFSSGSWHAEHLAFWKTRAQLSISLISACMRAESSSNRFASRLCSVTLASFASRKRWR